MFLHMKRRMLFDVLSSKRGLYCPTAFWTYESSHRFSTHPFTHWSFKQYLHSPLYIRGGKPPQRKTMFNSATVSFAESRFRNVYDIAVKKNNNCYWVGQKKLIGFKKKLFLFCFSYFFLCHFISQYINSYIIKIISICMFFHKQTKY